MKSLRGGLVMAMTAGALVILPMSNGRVTRIVARAAPGQATDPKTIYAPQQKEFWLSADEFGYIRPGLKITVNSITINDGLHPVVDINYTDDWASRSIARDRSRPAPSLSTWSSPGGTPASVSTPPIRPGREAEPPGAPTRASR